MVVVLVVFVEVVVVVVVVDVVVLVVVSVTGGCVVPFLHKPTEELKTTRSTTS